MSNDAPNLILTDEQLATKTAAGDEAMRIIQEANRAAKTAWYAISTRDVMQINRDMVAMTDESQRLALSKAPNPEEKRALQKFYDLKNGELAQAQQAVQTASENLETTLNQMLELVPEAHRANQKRQFLDHYDLLLDGAASPKILYRENPDDKSMHNKNYVPSDVKTRSGNVR